MSKSVRPEFSRIDAFDLAILREVQRDARAPHRLIAEAVGLSAPAVQRRIRRLEESGVIQANVAIVNPVSVGRPITLIVEVTVENEQVASLERMKLAFTSDDEVQQCYYVTGEADFVLIVTVTSMANYEALTKRLFFANGNVKKFRTFVAMDRVKVGLSLPLGNAEASI